MEKKAWTKSVTGKDGLRGEVHRARHCENEEDLLI